MLGRNEGMIQRRGASQAATFIVAASDSLHPGRADYVCTGDCTAEVEAAIVAIQNSATGSGTIILKDVAVPDVVIPENITIISLKDGNGNIPPRMLSSVCSPGLGANPRTALELGGQYENEKLLDITLSPSSRVHDLTYDDVRDCVWGITRSETATNYLFRVGQDGTLTETAIGANPYRAMAVMYADGYVWIACIGGVTPTPAKLLKVNPSTLTITEYEMDAGENLAWNIGWDGTYIYMCLGTTPGQIIKFNPSTETHTTIETTGMNSLYWMDFDGRYMWANGNVGGAGSNCGLVKFDTTDDSFVVYDLGADMGTSVHEIAFDGHYIWLGCVTNTQIGRFDPDTEDTQIVPMEVAMQLVAWDGEKIWGVGWDSVWTIDPTTLIPERIVFDETIYYPHGLVFDGRHIWYSQWIDAAHLWRIPAYHASIGAAHTMVFDAAQTAIPAAATRYIDTGGLSTTEAITQISIRNTISIKELTIAVSANDCDAASGFRIAKNGVLVGDTCVVDAAETGTKLRRMIGHVFFKRGDLLSIKAWTTSSTSGSITVGKVSILVRE